MIKRLKAFLMGLKKSRNTINDGNDNELVAHCTTFRRWDHWVK